MDGALVLNIEVPNGETSSKCHLPQIILHSPLPVNLAFSFVLVFFAHRIRCNPQVVNYI